MGLDESGRGGTASLDIIPDGVAWHGYITTPFPSRPQSITTTLYFPSTLFEIVSPPPLLSTRPDSPRLSRNTLPNNRFRAKRQEKEKNNGSHHQNPRHNQRRRHRPTDVEIPRQKTGAATTARAAHAAARFAGGRPSDERSGPCGVVHGCVWRTV